MASALSEQGEASRRQHGMVPLFDGDGREVEVELAAGAGKTVRHGLGRRPRGWLLLSLRCADAAATDVHPFERARSSETLSLQSTCSADVTFTLYVF